MEPFTNELLAQREAQYGDYRDKCGTVTFVLETLADAPSWRILPDDMKCSIMMIVMKLARIVHGNPNHKDSWADISGYAELISRRLADAGFITLSQEATDDGLSGNTKQTTSSIPPPEPYSQRPAKVGIPPTDQAGFEGWWAEHQRWLDGMAAG